jgi:hypothetical protein
LKGKERKGKERKKKKRGQRSSKRTAGMPEETGSQTFPGAVED